MDPAQMQAIAERVGPDLAFLAEALKPDPAAPKARVSNTTVFSAISGCPGMSAIGKDVEAKTAEIEGALKRSGCLTDQLDKLEGTPRRSALLIYWKLFQKHPSMLKELEAAPVTLEQKTDELISEVVQMGTKLLMQAQMLVPNFRWIEATLAVARASALIANQLWSNEDAASVEEQRRILEDEQLRMPKLSLAVEIKPMDGTEILPGKKATVNVNVTREHTGNTGAAAGPQGIFEAYWLFLQSKKEKGQPDLLVGAQPVVVKDLEQKVMKLQVGFMAPPAGKWELTAHVISTSVAGVDYSMDAAFEVVEDDVPELK